MRQFRNLLTVAAATAVALAALTVGAPADTTRTPGKDLVQTAAEAGQFKTLASLLTRAGLVKTLKGKGPYTVFAPTDAAFAKVPHATLEALGKDRAKLRSVLLYHVVKGRLTAAEVTKRRAVTTLNGRQAAIRVRGGKVFVDGARVVTPDVTATNGVVHVIDKVLLPR